MTTFADSSALVKLYADEPDHAEIRDLVAIAVSQIVRVEVPAALWRKHRLGEVDASDAQILTAEFEADYFGGETQPRFFAVMLTQGILDAAARLCASHRLRASDAVQLSSALAARNADETCSRFAAYDESLRAAAAAEGFQLVPPARTGAVQSLQSRQPSSE